MRKKVLCCCLFVVCSCEKLIKQSNLSLSLSKITTCHSRHFSLSSFLTNKLDRSTVTYTHSLFLSLSLFVAAVAVLVVKSNHYIYINRPRRTPTYLLLVVAVACGSPREPTRLAYSSRFCHLAPDRQGAHAR